VKSEVRHLFVFVGSCIITAVAWLLIWPEKPRTMVEATQNPQVSAAVGSWTRDQIDTRIAAVRNASTDQARLDASIDLLEIPAEDVPEVLERMKSEIERDFSQVAQILVIRWASSDGEAAANWAWKNFRTGPQWENIFNQIGPAWAAHHPAGFYAWVLETARNRSDVGSSISLAEAESSEEPLLDYSLLRKIPGWLITEDPHLAYKVILATNIGFSDLQLPDSLASVSKVREALLAFDEPEPLEATKGASIGRMKNSLLLRWNELDPEDFNRSSFADQIVIDAKTVITGALKRWSSLPEKDRAQGANRLVAEADSAARDERITAVAQAWAETDPVAAVRWLDSLPPENEVSANTARVKALAAHDLNATLDRADRLPDGLRRNSLVIAFDAWSKAHPGKRADRAGWSAARIQAWEDLEALQPQRGG
jgi:hypothetical protein